MAVFWHDGKVPLMLYGTRDKSTAVGRLLHFAEVVEDLSRGQSPELLLVVDNANLDIVLTHLTLKSLLQSNCTNARQQKRRGNRCEVMKHGIGENPQSVGNHAASRPSYLRAEHSTEHSTKRLIGGERKGKKGKACRETESCGPWHGGHSTRRDAFRKAGSGTRTDGRVNCVFQLNVVIVALLKESLCVDHVLANGTSLPWPV